MARVSRRAFIATSAVIPFSRWIEQVGLAQAGPLVRYDATSADGQRMLQLYTAAASKMMNTISEGDPSHWSFQWYTHAVRPDRSKAAELARVYPQSSSNKALAEEMWSTCQAHFEPQNEPFFLPWHRMYVYFFERIVRKVSGDTSFTLPYWNCSTTAAGKHGVIPRGFRLPADPAFKSLYRANRNAPSAFDPTTPNVNKGDPIDQDAPGSLDLAALKQGTYLPLGALPGFNQSIDFGLHGTVHVEIGNSTNMGNVPWAARDPIFWLHHCNIDRLWASWNKNGGVNPGGSWLTQTFVFADENGNRVAAKVDDFKDLGPLNCTYDQLEPAPGSFQPLPVITESVTPESVIVMRGRADLGTGPTRVALEPAGTGTPRLMRERTKALAPNRRIYLIVRQLKAEAAPGVLYNVYFDLPEGSPAAGRNPHHVGTINFFDAAPHEGHRPEERAGKFISFDVTEVARDLQGRQLLAERPVVTIAPVGRPAAAAKPAIGELALAEQ